MFQELAAAIEYTCKFCAAGTFFVSETEICSICSAGTYQLDNDQRSVACEECPTGRYQQDAALDATNHDTLEDCLHCSAGTFFVSKTEICQNCDGGQYQHLNDAPAASCKFCAKSTEYVSPSEACTTCLTGLYQNEEARANVDCKYCARGREYIDKSTQCSICEAGEFQDQDNMTSPSCKTCQSLGDPPTHLNDPATDAQYHDESEDCQGKCS